VDEISGAQLHRVVEGVHTVLGPELVGAYLFGSAVLGGLEPGSDLDVLAVTRRATTRDQKQRLVEHLLGVTYTPRHVELTIVAQPEIRPWRYPPVRDFQYGDWWRSEFEAGNLEPWPEPTDPDLASLVTMVLLDGATLVGPPPADVLDPVPCEDYLRAMRQCVVDVMRDVDGDTRNVILTLARVWYSVATGGVASKDDAADWALARLPAYHHAVVERARAIYLGKGEDAGWEPFMPDVRIFADHVVGEIERIVPDA
jgi:streptomycin 3"-adenylyltransferase